MADQTPSGESVEITWPLDATTMYGTLVRPAGAGPFPAVVMVAGSGPTDRDWNSPLLPGANGSARLIAEALATAGIRLTALRQARLWPACAREHAGLIGKMSMQSHLDELAGAVDDVGKPGVRP